MCCGVASGYGYAVWSTYGATGVQGTPVVLYDMTKSDENFGDNYFIIFNRDLVRDQDEVYIYATTLMEYKRALLYILPPLT